MNMGSLFLFFCFALMSCAHAESNFKIPSGKIIGGTPINIKEVPYQVSIQLQGHHVCGGAIVDTNVIVTAAHCLNFEPSDYTVRIGSTYCRRGGDIYNVANFVKHPGFHFNTMDTDVGVILLADEIQFTENAKTIQMQYSNEEVPDDALMMVTGWGSIIEGGGAYHILQMVIIPKLSDTYCKIAYGNRISSTMMCAGYIEGGKDSCQFDSGGPLVYNNKLVGIVSWGDGCGRPGAPGVYTKVSAVRSWVDTTIQQLQFLYASSTRKWAF